MPNLLKIDPENPEPERIDEAARIIRAGGLVVFPTSGLYGLAVDALNREAVDRVFAVKGRSAKKPLSVLVKDLAELRRIVRMISTAASTIMDRFWPGGVTIVFQAAKNLPQNLTAGTGKIGIGLPRHPAALALVRGAVGPVTATSANVSGRAGCFDIRDLDPEIAGHADLILDAGTLSGGAGSTVVDVTADPPVILREGAVAAAAIRECLASVDFRRS